MKNKFHAFFYITATLLLLLNISSCSGIVSPSEQESPSASRGLSLRGRFSLAEASAVPSEYQAATSTALQASRNAIPDTSTLTYSVSATNASNGNIVWATSANSTSYEFNGNLTAGTWEITAYAKQSTAVVLQSEQKTVTLSKLAMDASESLTMAPSTSGSGSIDLTVNWASDSGIGYCNYSKPDGITITTTSGQPDRITAESIEAGIYTVTLSFYTSEDNYNSGAAPLYKCEEYLAVYPGLETNTWTTSTASHITSSGSFNVTLDSVHTFVYRTIYVDSASSSSKPNGTSEQPYKTIESAMTRLNEVAAQNIITDISATKPWELHVKGTHKAPSGIGNNFINATSAIQYLKIIGEGSGATIDADTNCRVLNVASGANVTIENITLKNGRQSGGSGVYVSGTLTMESGSTISGSKTTGSAGSGGGVFVDSSGKFYMNGGTISGNEAKYGGGICVSSGGLFEMTGGKISGCTAPIASNGEGGGICSNGTLSISGGSVEENSGTVGAGVCVKGGSVTITTGCSITKNTAVTNGNNIYISSGASSVSVPAGNNSFYDDTTNATGYPDAICCTSGNSFARFNQPNTSANYIDTAACGFTGDATIYLGTSDGASTTWKSDCHEIAKNCEQNLTITPTNTSTSVKATIKNSSSTESTDYLIHFNKSGKTLTLTRLILDGNSKKCGVAKLEAGTLTATNCTFQYGKARDGGGLYVNNSTTATLTSCTVQYCNAEKDNGTTTAYGGGIYTRGVVTFSGTIQNCSTKGVGGGAVVEAASGASFTMTDGTITSCNAESTGSSGGDGGGVYTYWTFSMEGGTITGCTSERNGAGVYLGRANSSTPELQMSGNACVNSNNEVYVGSYKIKITGDLTASKAATISPSSYSTTTQVLTDDSSGSLVNANFRKFSVTPELSDGKTIVWVTLSNGKLSATTITLTKETLPSFEPISSIDYDITVDETFDGTDVRDLIQKLNDTVGNKTVLDLSRANVTAMDSSLYWVKGGISSITFPDSCTNISFQIFQSATDLTEIKISNSNSTFCTVDGVMYSKDKKKLLHYPAAKEGSTFTLPSTVNTLGYGAFERNKYLETINGLTQIKHLESMVTFSSTLKLKEVDLSGLTDTTLEDYTFQYSTGIEKVTLSSSTQYISFGCFRGLTNLKEVHFKTTTPPPLDASDDHAYYRNFKECPNVKFYVPSSAVNAYKNATGEKGFSNPEYNGAATTTSGIQAKIFGE